MIEYGEPPSNQNELDIDSPGAQLMKAAREWAEQHEEAWNGYKNMACAYSRSGAVSPNLLLQLMRNIYRVSVRNAFGPALARIAMEQDDRIRFRVAKSKCDGFCEVVL